VTGSVPALAPDRVHVWYLSLATAPVTDLASLLTEGERTRAARFVFEPDRRRFVATRGWLRHLLGRYLGLAPGAIVLGAGPQGKPSFEARGSQRGIEFNVSHSGDRSLLAFSLGRPVGVDVELMADKPDLDDLARACFTPRELERFTSSPSNRRLESFFGLWTAKEAYLKTKGGGLSIPLQEFQIEPLGHPDWEARRIGEAGSPLRGRWLPIEAPYAAAVAVEGTGWQIDRFHLPDRL